ncbi:MAG: tRNA epoxyqueuosine(34) reductase QueG [Terriglobales bacterium]
MPTFTAITELIKRTAAELCFDAAGIAPVRAFPELDYFSQWLAAGRAGDMRYLEARDENGELKRASLRRVAPWAKSVIVCAKNYNTAPPYSIEFHEPEHGWISRYAWSQRDYHDVLLNALRQLEAEVREAAHEPGMETRCYVDTGPLVERVYARYAGIGWLGKNTCIINQRLGSWLFLGVILTSLELEPDLPAPDRCGSCTRCLEACPTDAIVAPYELDAQRCISYLTIEKRGEIPEDLRAQIGRHVFGCDICQDVCPWNRRAPITTAEEFQPRDRLVNPALQWLAELGAEEFSNQFRGSAIKRAKRSGLRRNAAVAMGNSSDRRFVPALEKLAQDPDETVAEHARWALQQLEEL